MPSPAEAQPTQASEAFRAAAPNRLRILVVCADPLDGGRSPGGRRTWNDLSASVKALALPVALFRLLPPTLETLKDTLRTCADRAVPPHVLHVVGSLTSDRAGLEDEVGKHVPLDRESLAEVLAGCGVPIVLLQGTEPIDLASHIAQTKLAAASIAYPRTERLTGPFAVAFFRNLAAGQSVEAAIQQAADGSGVELFGEASLVLPASQAQGPRIFDGTPHRNSIPEAPPFFGRDAELLSIGEALSEAECRAVALVGPGGIGKTTLALEAAHRHAWRFPGGLAFCSLRGQEATAENLLRMAATALMVPSDGPLNVVVQGLTAVLEVPGLLVFDNLEELDEEELGHLFRYLEGLLEKGAKALLTLRPVPEVFEDLTWVRSVNVSNGLDPEAGSQLLRDHAERRGISGLAQASTDADGFRLQVSRALYGHPKMLEVAVGMAARGDLTPLRTAAPDPGGGALEASALNEATLQRRMADLFEAAARLLSEESQKILELVPMFPDGSFSLEEMSACEAGSRRQDIPEVLRPSLIAGMEDLVRAGFLEAPEARIYRFHSTVGRFALETYRVSEDARAGASLALVVQAMDFVRNHVDDYDAVEARIGHLISLFESAWPASENIEGLQAAIASAVDRLGYFFHSRGHGQILSRWRDRVSHRGGERGRDLYKLSVALHQQGLVRAAFRTGEEAIAALSDSRDPGAQELRDALQAALHPPPAATVEDFRRLLDETHGHLQSGDAEAAIPLARKALKAASGRPGAESVANFLLGQALLATGKKSEAIEPLRRSEALLETAGADEQLVTVRALLAIASGERVPPDLATPQGRLAAAFEELKEDRPEEALKLLETVTKAPVELEGQLRAIRAQAFGQLRRFDEALADVDTVLSMVRASGNAEDEEQLLRLQDNLRTARDLERLAETPLDDVRAAETHPAARARQLSRKATADLHAGRPEAARAAFALAQQEAQSSADLGAQLQTVVERIAALAAHRPSDALGLIDEAQNLASRMNPEAKAMVDGLAQKVREAVE